MARDISGRDKISGSSVECGFRECTLLRLPLFTHRANLDHQENNVSPMQTSPLSSMKAVLSALPLLALAATFFAFSESVGPLSGALAPIALLLAVLVFFYVSGTRGQ